MFLYIVLTPISTTSGLRSTAIRVNTSNSTYTFTSVYMHLFKNDHAPGDPLMDHFRSQGSLSGLNT